MRITPPRPFTACLTALLLLSGAPGIAQDESAVLTSVFGKTEKSYKRKKDADGKWVREYYAMSNGGPVDGTIKDNAQEKIKFVAIATVLAEHLARQGYFPATDPDKVDFLLVVNWGRTMPFQDGVHRSGVDNVLASINDFKSASGAAQIAAATAAQQQEQQGGGGGVSATASPEEMQAQAAQSQMDSALLTQNMLSRARDQNNAKTAHLLGYMGDINKADGIQRFAGGGRVYDDLIADIEEARYYIILSAYEFKSTVRDQKPKLQWVTRMSMRAPGNNFAETAASMIAYSASRFGQNTDGLERKLYPQYKVNLEDIRFLGVADQSAAPAAQGKTEEK
jgi:hypothetical protein